MTVVVDRIESAADRIKDDEFLADKKRFESFKLGKAPPAGSSSQSRRHSHSRSHSRNVSISISPSPSLPLSLPSHDVSLSSSCSISSLSQLSSTPATAAKRGSHHRRCSSLSTRRDSAEVMGVSLPALSTSISEDNISLGDKDSIRRRALWALEGKPSPDGFSPVEIPELNTPEIERRISELPSKPSFPPPLGSFGSGLSGLANMRDSFGNRPTSSIKDQLHTLVEEEEEEEEESQALSSPSASPAALPPNVPTSPTPSRVRHRPAGLSLRPLSLSPEKLLSTANGELPTPVPTPTPSKLSGLRSLTLTASPPNLMSPPPTSDGILSSAPALQRRPGVAPPTLASSSAPLCRRPSMDNVSSGCSDPFEAPKRRSSISYKSSFHGLPTPELTPTTDRRTSTGSDSDCSRPSSVSNEQHFLYQSQATLIARISELERALAFRTQSRPVSLAASDVCLIGPAPTDEMLSLIADLKAERDELKRDIDGWRTRVADLEKQTSALTHRIDVERRDAWIAREHRGLLEVEKRAAVRAAEEGATAVSGLKAELATIEAELQAMLDDAARSKEVALELERVKVELAEEHRRRVELEKMLESNFNAPTPIIPARRVMSIDSLSSATDVDSLDGHILTGPELKAVQEVDEDEESYSDQEDNLIGYEDEEEGDESFTSHDGSSFSSLEDIPRSTAHLVPSTASSPSHTPSPASLPVHVRHSSLSREWSFPGKGMPHAASPQHVPEEIDRFFGCLEDLGDSPPTPSAAPEATNPFSRGFFSTVEDDGNELPPFVLPADVGTEVEFPSTEDSLFYAGPGLGVVLEEEEPEDVMDVSVEDEFIGEADEGGIKFTFNAPPGFASPESSESPSPTTPVLTPVGHKPVLFHEPAIEDDDGVPFHFPLMSHVSRTRGSPPSPSAIPRAIALRRFEGPDKDSKYSPSRSSPLQPSASQHTLPPNKCDGSRPSCLPQRITKPALAPTFIPQPTTKARESSSMSSAQSLSQPPPGGTAVRSSSADASLGASVHPFAALQNLASFVPLPSTFSWSGMRGVSSEGPSTGESNNNRGKAEEQKKGFVSKERQLARLRERMAAEENTILAGAQTRDVKEQQLSLLCKRCVDRVVAP